MSRASSFRNDLKEMVQVFRVSELTIICGVAGVSKIGKKQELYTRVLSLLRDPSSQVESKIRELYKRNYPGLPPPPPTESISQPAGSSQQQATGRYRVHSSTGVVPTGSAAQQRSSGVAQMRSGGPGIVSGQYHQSVSQAKPLVQTPRVHPDVKFKVIPFYDTYDVIFKPLCLGPHNATATYQDAYFTFVLTEVQIRKVTESPMVPVYGVGGSVIDRSNQVQVQMRFCLMETTCEQLDNYPPYINVRINGKPVELPPVLPQSKAGQTPKRSPKPLNITKYCKLDQSSQNHVQIQWTTEFGRTWVAGVFLVKENDSQTLLQRLKNRGARSADHSRALIKDKLKIDPDSEIAMTTLRISLNCPLGVCRMTMPVRSKSCTHVQCFDASFYVRMNEKRPRWQCPVCSKDAPFSELQLDGYFIEALEQSTYDCTEIYCYDDGSWEPIDGDRKNVQTISNTPKASAKPPTDLKKIATVTAPFLSKVAEPSKKGTEPAPKNFTSNNLPQMPPLLHKTSNEGSPISGGLLQTGGAPDASHSDETEPEIIDLSSDSDVEDTTKNQRPLSTISISSASPANNVLSPFPSPPLLIPPTNVAVGGVTSVVQCDTNTFPPPPPFPNDSTPVASAIENLEYSTENRRASSRKRTHESSEEAAAAAAYVAKQQATSSRAFLNPAQAPPYAGASSVNMSCNPLTRTPSTFTHFPAPPAPPGAPLSGTDQQQLSYQCDDGDCRGTVNRVTPQFQDYGMPPLTRHAAAANASGLPPPPTNSAAPPLPPPSVPPSQPGRGFIIELE